MLVTLGIIGVVAALTLPSLITNYRRKELETRFKKSSSIIEQIISKMVIEYSVDDLVYGETKDTFPNESRGELNNYYKEQLNILEVLTIANGASKTELTKKIIRIPVYNFDGSKSQSLYFQGFVGSYDTGLPGQFGYLLNDGTFFSTICFQHHGVQDGIKITFDTNGPFKGPNRYGFDIFVYDSGYWNANKCNSQYNYGCYKYAKANTYPDDPSKEYWANLKFY